MTRAHPSLIPSKLVLGLSAMVSLWDMVVGVVVSVADIRWVGRCLERGGTPRTALKAVPSAEVMPQGHLVTDKT